MATPVYSFTYKELAKILIREAGVTEGLWGVRLTFGLQGTNVGSNEEDIVPAAILAISEIGLQRFQEPNGLTVDASTVPKK